MLALQDGLHKTHTQVFICVREHAFLNLLLCSKLMQTFTLPQYLKTNKQYI